MQPREPIAVANEVEVFAPGIRVHLSLRKRALRDMVRAVGRSSFQVNPQSRQPLRGSLVSEAVLAREALQHHFGFADFREGQAEVIESVLAGHNAVVVMPTGGGKSLCYQLPAL